MPSAPNLDGLPLWLQITLTLAFGLATLRVAFTGYFKPKSEGAALVTGGSGLPVSQVQSALLTDMGAIRHLSDVCIQLTGKMESMETAVREQTHWIRTQHELDREICARLRELREAIERRAT